MPRSATDPDKNMAQGAHVCRPGVAVAVAAGRCSSIKGAQASTSDGAGSKDSSSDSASEDDEDEGGKTDQNEQRTHSFSRQNRIVSVTKRSIRRRGCMVKGIRVRRC